MRVCVREITTKLILCIIRIWWGDVWCFLQNNLEFLYALDICRRNISRGNIIHKNHIIHEYNMIGTVENNPLLPGATAFQLLHVNIQLVEILRLLLPAWWLYKYYLIFLLHLLLISIARKFLIWLNRKVDIYRASSMLDDSLAESLKNKVTTSSTKLGLESSCNSSNW